jgi:hypothetical protein
MLTGVKRRRCKSHQKPKKRAGIEYGIPYSGDKSKDFISMMELKREKKRNAILSTKGSTKILYEASYNEICKEKDSMAVYSPESWLKSPTVQLKNIRIRRLSKSVDLKSEAKSNKSSIHLNRNEESLSQKLFVIDDEQRIPALLNQDEITMNHYLNKGVQKFFSDQACIEEFKRRQRDKELSKPKDSDLAQMLVSSPFRNPKDFYLKQRYLPKNQKQLLFDVYADVKKKAFSDKKTNSLNNSKFRVKKVRDGLLKTGSPENKAKRRFSLNKKQRRHSGDLRTNSKCSAQLRVDNENSIGKSFFFKKKAK